VIIVTADTTTTSMIENPASCFLMPMGRATRVPVGMRDLSA
jgi:hypothetical protein